jgi:peptide/nickel transport system substrate-binding protein
VSRGLAAAALAVAALGASACRNEVPPPPLDLTVAYEAPVATLDPREAVDTVSHAVLSNVYESLVDFDHEMSLRPLLAVSWTTPEPGLWVFRLREGVRDHAGRPLVAEDVALALEAARAESSPLHDRLGTVTRVEAAGPAEVRLRTSAADPLLAYRLATVLIAPPTGTPGRPRPGTGPFRLVRSGDDGVEVEAFAGYWGRRPVVRRARFVHVTPGADTTETVRREAVDLLRYVPEAHADEASALPGYRLVEGPSLRAVYAWMDSRPAPAPSRNPFADRRVRRAVSLAVDRAELVARLRGHGLALSQLVPPGIIGHEAGEPVPGPEPSAAQRLVAEAGFERGFATPLAFVGGLEPFAESIRDDLGLADIRVALRKTAWPELMAGWRSGRLPFFLASWRFETGEASLFLAECVRSRRGALSWNAGYADPEVDTLIDALLGSRDGTARDRRLAGLVRRLREEAPLVPLVARRDLYLVREGLAWSPRLDGRIRLAGVGPARAPTSRVRRARQRGGE